MWLVGDSIGGTFPCWWLGWILASDGSELGGWPSSRGWYRILALKQNAMLEVGPAAARGESRGFSLRFRVGDLGLDVE